MLKVTNSEENSHQVYIYYNPLKQDQAFYIGETGTEKRWKYHLEEAKKFIRQKKSQKWIQRNADNPVKTRTIMKILRAGLEPKIKKVMEGVDEKTSKAEEIRLIAHHGRADKGLGPLTNLTDGGDGGGVDRIDLTGQKYGRLKIIRYVDNKDTTRWFCRCDCGIEKIIRGSSIKNGSIQSCGCLQKETVKKANTKHGMYGSPIYRTWNNIISRCNNTNHEAYKNYGGRGITVTDRWKNSFENFYGDMGDRPSNKHILGRIEINGNYEPENCKWLTRTEVNNNTRGNKLLTIDDETRTMKEWSDISKTKYNTIKSRLRYGWTHKQAIYGKK